MAMSTFMNLKLEDGGKARRSYKGAIIHVIPKRYNSDVKSTDHRDRFNRRCETSTVLPSGTRGQWSASVVINW